MDISDALTKYNWAWMFWSGPVVSSLTAAQTVSVDIATTNFVQCWHRREVNLLKESKRSTRYQSKWKCFMTRLMHSDRTWTNIRFMNSVGLCELGIEQLFNAVSECLEFVANLGRRSFPKHTTSDCTLL